MALPAHPLLSTSSALLALVTAGAFGATEPSSPLYHPPGMWVWDFWFARHNDTYHAFYLQAPFCLLDGQLKHGNQHVGHASSSDLLHWTNHGPALVPINGTWNDLSIATGSVVAHDGAWGMLYSGRGSKISGVGLAVSDDLLRWRKLGDGPVVRFGTPFPATWKGQQVEWTGLADPYVYPSPVDGWYHMLLNARMTGVPLSQSGCIATMRSRDLKTWEAHSILAYPGWFERLETPQIWQRGGRWYLYVGGAHDHGLPEAYLASVPETVHRNRTRLNIVLTSDSFEGPFEPTGTWWLDLPDGRGFYIAKVFKGPDGSDVLMATVDCKLSRPYPVTYAADGSLIIGAPR